MIDNSNTDYNLICHNFKLKLDLSSINNLSIIANISKNSFNFLALLQFQYYIDQN